MRDETLHQRIHRKVGDLIERDGRNILDFLEHGGELKPLHEDIISAAVQWLELGQEQNNPGQPMRDLLE